jgi:hypothetical protein
MAEITKQALKVDNNTSFPNNNNGAITPAILRAFNVNMIDSMVDELGYNVDSASWNSSISNINAFTASAQSLTTASLLITASAAGNVITFTKGNNTTFNVTVATGSIPDISNLNQATASLQAFTQSAQISINNLNTTTASLNSSVTQLNANTASQQISIDALNVSSASQQISIDNLNSKTGSYATTGSNTFVGANTFTSISASSFVSASEFIGNGSKITGITASIALPILDEGIPQGNAFSMNFTGSGISAIVVGGTAVVSVNTPDSGTINNLTASFNAYTSSTNLDLAAIHQATASLQAFTQSFSTSSLVSTSSFNAYTSSTNIRLNNIETTTASLLVETQNLELFSASALVSISNLNASSASQQISIDALNTNSASVNTSVTNLNSATASLFTSASLGLTTASFAGNTLTFTKGNGTTFGVVIPDVSGSAGTTIFETVYTGESITKGDPLYISGSQGANPIVFKADAANPLKMPVTFISNETIGAANTTQAIVLGLIEGIDLTGYTAGQTIYVAEGTGGYSINLPSGSNSVTQLLGVITKGGSGGKGLVLNPGPAQLPGLDTGKMWVGNGNNQPIEITTASFASSASFNSYTSSNDQKVNSLIAATGSYATTGSNTFTGDQTLVDAAGNSITLTDTSGSLMLVMKGFTSSSLHMSASVSGTTNLIFKTNNNTADTIISGSGNIFTNAFAPTAGFKRYIGGSGNYFNGTIIPQISSSMQFSPAMNRNIAGGAYTFRAPVSSSTYTINDNLSLNASVNFGTAASPFTGMVAGCNFQQNILAGGTVNMTSNVSTLDFASSFNTNIIFGATVNINNNSSSLSYISNIQNGGITINNNYVPVVGSTSAFRTAYASINTVYGVNHRIDYAGTNATTSSLKSSIANLLAGTYITASIQETGDSSSLIATNLMGNGLIVSGTSLNPVGSATPSADATYGTVISGRFNAVDGNRAKSAETIFAIGTGTGHNNRKTGFLIDSGSNAFIEGTLNVSGSTTITGSLILSSSNAIELQVIGDTQFTGSLIMSSSAAVELTIIGNMVVTGSAFGNVISMSISSNTASMNLNTGNYFTLSIPTGTTRISPSNIQPGTSATLVITTASGSLITFDSSVKQPSGSAYVPTSGSVDVLSFVAVNSSSLYVVSTKNMI